jgi:hypothetical protein
VDARVPDEFLQVQWTWLPDGVTPPAFAQRVRQLLEGETPAMRHAAPIEATRDKRDARATGLSVARSHPSRRPPKLNKRGTNVLASMGRAYAVSGKPDKAPPDVPQDGPTLRLPARRPAMSGDAAAPEFSRGAVQLGLKSSRRGVLAVPRKHFPTESGPLCA